MCKTNLTTLYLSLAGETPALPRATPLRRARQRNTMFRTRPLGQQPNIPHTSAPFASSDAVELTETTSEEVFTPNRGTKSSFSCDPFSPATPRSDDANSLSSYAYVLEKRVNELEETEERSASARARLEDEVAELRAELATPSDARRVLGDITNGARATSKTGLKIKSSALKAARGASAVEGALKAELKTTTERAEKAEREAKDALEDNEWLQSALRTKCAEIANLAIAKAATERRASGSEEALSTSESRLRAALDELDAAKAESKSERKRFKQMREKYKSLKKERAELSRLLESLPVVESTPAPRSRARAALKFVMVAMEHGSPIAAACVALFHFLTFLYSLRGRFIARFDVTSGFDVASSFDGSGFDVSGFGVPLSRLPRVSALSLVRDTPFIFTA